MAELEKILADLPATIEKLRISNEQAAATGIAAAKEAADEQAAHRVELEKLAAERNAKGQFQPKEQRTTAQRELEELNLNAQIAAERNEATAQWQLTNAGQAASMKKSLEDQGKIAEDSKEYTKLNYEAQREDINERLKNPDLSGGAKKELEQENRR